MELLSRCHKCEPKYSCILMSLQDIKHAANLEITKNLAGTNPDQKVLRAKPKSHSHLEIILRI